MHRDTLERLKVFLIVLAVFFVFSCELCLENTGQIGQSGRHVLCYAELNIGRTGMFDAFISKEEESAFMPIFLFDI